MFYRHTITLKEKTWHIAPVWKRAGAMIVDFLIICTLAFVPFVNFALMIGYGLTRDSWKYLKGKSIGKHIFGIRVIKTYTNHDIYLDYSEDINRNLFLTFFAIDFLTLFFSKTKQRIGDKFAGTIVLEDTKELKRWNKEVLRNNKRYVKIYDDWDSHGVR